VNNNEKSKRKNNKFSYVIGIVLALVLVTVITYTTYAYFSATVIGNSTNTVLSTGTMAIEFSDGPQVRLNNAIPGTYVEKTFTVTNVGTIDTYYDIYLSDLINNFANKSDLVYTLSSTDGGQNISESEIPSVSTKIVSSKAIAAGVTHSYTLRIEFKETNTNQDINKGKTFSTIVRINELI